MTIRERIEAIAAHLGVAVPHDAVPETTGPAFWSDVLASLMSLL